MNIDELVENGKKLAIEVYDNNKYLTVAELYNLAKQHGALDYKLLVFDPWEELAYPVNKNSVKFNKQQKSVVVME